MKAFWLVMMVSVGAASVNAQDVKYINPSSLAASPRFTQLMEVPASTLVYISGQVGANVNGQLAGPDFRAQAVQVFENLKAALAAAQLGPSDIVSIDSFLVNVPENLAAYREVRENFFANTKDRPTSTTVGVVALVIPGALLEVNAVARKPASRAGLFVTSVLRAKPGMRDELRVKLNERATASKNEPGCVRYELLNQTDDPDVFLLNEAWANDAALETHFKTEGYVKWQAMRDKLVASRQFTKWQAVAQ